MEKQPATTTHHQIDKTTYIVVAAPGDNARERLEVKINKLLQRDLRQCAKSS